MDIEGEEGFEFKTGKF